MALGEAFLASALQVALEKLASPILREFGSRFSVDKDLKKLAITLSKIQAVLLDAEAKQISDTAVQLWLQELKEIAYAADDVLDAAATEALRIKGENKVTHFLSLSKDFISKFGLAPKITEINEKLADLAKERDELGLREGIVHGGSDVRERPQTSSLIDESCVFGREGDKDKIVESLISDEYCRQDVCVISIVGMGGLGKTTLAQLVYNDENVSKHFELKMWVCVSDDFNVRRLTKSILESAARKSSDLLDLDILQNNLLNALRGRRFLIVLDDVWNEKKTDWDVLSLPFRAGAMGSRIIVTTRSEKVSSIMGTILPHRLGGLSDDYCWLLFKQRAFVNGNADAYPNLVPIGKEIVKKCKGLPLAAKTLGGLLYSKTEEYEWDMILKSEIWDLEENDNEILPALRLSYNHLPAHLKQCFAYCSIFPEDYNFDKEELVLLWIAEGFVHSKGRRRIEDMASDYFDDLLLRSFFQHFETKSSKFVMHGLIHDLAKVVAGETCFTLESEKGKVTEKARYASVLVNTFKSVSFDALFTATSLRTMLLLSSKSPHEMPVEKFPHDLIQSLTCLRSLDLSHIAIKELPDSIGELGHLRYLDLSSTYIRKLPESTCSLYNLQALILISCSKLVELPKNTEKLVNLRHLNLTACWHLTSMPPHIGKLTSLQKLHRFVAGKESGCGIDELKDINEPRATLCIDSLDKVVKITEARQANLKKKPYLQKLVLGWSFRSYMPNGIDEELLECLEPHANLRELKLDFYHGAKFPNWMGDSSLSHLEKIDFSHCSYCKSLPPLGQLPLLKHLAIDTMVELDSMGREFLGNGKIHGFPSLEKLRLEDMSKLKDWHEIENGEFPLLKELRIINCPNIASLPKFRSLQDLVLDDCNEMVLGSVHFLTSLSSLKISNFQRMLSLPKGLLQPLHALKELTIQHSYRLEALTEDVGLQDLMSLQRLEILCCPKLKSFSKKGLPSTLQYLSISVCSSLQSLPDGLQNLTSLEELRISKCAKLASFPAEKLPRSLKFISIYTCGNLESLPMDLHELSSLEHLDIGSCQKLAFLPEEGLPATLRSLSITGCELLEKRCQKGGEDWPKIDHIPNVEISNI